MNCKECGDEIEFCYTHNDELRKHELCFSCNFWYTHYTNKDKPEYVVVNGIKYHIGAKNNNPSRWNGFGGQYFKIKFHDGRIVETNNLWCNGHIPKNFRDRMPDNAIFMRD